MRRSRRSSNRAMFGGSRRRASRCAVWCRLKTRPARESGGAQALSRSRLSELKHGLANSWTFHYTCKSFAIAGSSPMDARVAEAPASATLNSWRRERGDPSLSDVHRSIAVAAAPGRHVVEDRLLAGEEADDLRHVAVDRLVVGDARSDGVGEGH